MADYLVKKGMPFRDAHRVVGQTVRYCVENDKTFDDLTLDEFKAQSELFDKDIFEDISLEHSVGARKFLPAARHPKQSKCRCSMPRSS